MKDETNLNLQMKAGVTLVMEKVVKNEPIVERVKRYVQSLTTNPPKDDASCWICMKCRDTVI